MADIGYTQPVDALNDGDLHGQDSWVNSNNPSSANCTVQTTIKYAGAKGLKLNGYCVYARSLSAYTTGQLWYCLRIDTTGAGDNTFLQLRNATQYNAIVKGVQVDASTYKLQYYSGGSYSDWQTGIATGSFHIIGIELDQPNNRYRLAFDSETFGSYVTQGTSGAAAGDTIRMGNDSSVSYIDEFSTTYPGGATTSVKTLNGLAIASVKSKNGLAKASIKNFNGLA